MFIYNCRTALSLLLLKKNELKRCFLPIRFISTSLKLPL